MSGPERRARAGEALRRPVHDLPPPPRDPAGDPASGVGNWNLANALTVLRLALVPVFAVLFAVDHGQTAGWRVAAWAAFAVAAVTDRLDGQVARSRGLVTEFGKLADPIADKALTGTAMVGLSLLGELSWWVTGVVLVRELGITALRFAVLRSGVLPASRGGKLKTLLLNVAIGLYILPLGSLLHTVSAVIMAAAVVVSTVTGVDYVGRAVRQRRQAARRRTTARPGGAGPVGPRTSEPATSGPLTAPAPQEGSRAG